MATRIVGIVLVRNEENFVAWALHNALDFCDEWLLIDNLSTDATAARLAAIAALHPRVQVISERNPLRTNAYLQAFIGEDVWVFGLDGDEIYDRSGLLRLRTRLLAGAYANAWSVQGHSLHATTLDLAAGTALGYGTPESAPATKLYNFRLIASWHVNTQRLHGNPVLLPGHNLGQRVALADTEAWEHCDFRNLHLCFFPRSRRQDEPVRMNITDRSFRNVVRRPVFRALQAMGLARGKLAAYVAPRVALKKLVRYMHGDLVTRSLDGIGRPQHAAALDPAWAETETLLAEMSAARAPYPDLRGRLD